jgi:hypothetical protein
VTLGLHMTAGSSGRLFENRKRFQSRKSLLIRMLMCFGSWLTAGMTWQTG